MGHVGVTFVKKNFYNEEEEGWWFLYVCKVEWQEEGLQGVHTGGISGRIGYLGCAGCISCAAVYRQCFKSKRDHVLLKCEDDKITARALQDDYG